MDVLVRNGRHMRPMLAILTRNDIGKLDKYGRGRWISKNDLPVILESIKSDESAIKGGASDSDWLCQGTNIHNHVWFREFEELFK